MVLALMIAVIAAGGLVIDGGRIMAARREAATVAASAARTAAQELDVAGFEDTNTVALVPDDAVNVARTLLTQQGYDDTDITVTGDTIRVVVRDDVPLTLLSLFGIGDRHITAAATAILTQQP